MLYILLVIYWGITICSFLMYLVYYMYCKEYDERILSILDMYRKWLNNKNIFGKIYTIIFMIITLIGIIMAKFFVFIIYIFIHIYELGKKQ